MKITQLLTFMLLIQSPLLFGAKFQKMTPEQEVELAKNIMVVTTDESKDSTWPIVHMRRLVRADPLTSVGIFLALDHQKEYVPNLIKSMPSKYISATEIHTSYEMELPWPLDKSVYIHGSILTKQGECYLVNWYMVESNSTDAVKGHASFCPHPNGTYVEYESFVEPKSIFAGFFKFTMVKDASSSIEAIMKYIEKCKIEKKELTKKYSKYILDSLKGIKVYSNLMKN